MIIAALVLICIAAALSVLIGFANGMADTPMERPLTFRLPALLLLVAFALFICSRAIAASDPAYPDPTLTPGVVRTGIAEDQVCKIKWGRDQRAVTEAMKRKVFEEYGYPKLNKDPRCPCEIDHRVPRELLGGDDIRNLWVQRYSGPYNAHDKDRLENFEHKAVCTGQMSLEAAQSVFLGDWTQEYDRIYGKAVSAATK